MKRCSSCRSIKPADAFNRNRSRKDGRQDLCRMCQGEQGRLWEQANRSKVRAKTNRWRRANPERAREQNREIYARDPGKQYAKTVAFRAANPEKVKAQAAVARAVKRGELARPTECEDCGEECRVQGHHPDYGQPLEVEWLCAPCHSLHDRGVA